jgi:hypothetical protein
VKQSIDHRTSKRALFLATGKPVPAILFPNSKSLMHFSPPQVGCALQNWFHASLKI